MFGINFGIFYGPSHPEAHLVFRNADSIFWVTSIFLNFPFSQPKQNYVVDTQKNHPTVIVLLKTHTLCTEEAQILCEKEIQNFMLKNGASS